MRGTTRIAVLVAVAIGVLVLPATAAANHGTRPHTQNMHALGHSPDFGSFLLPDGQRDVNSDLAFWASGSSTAITTASASLHARRGIPS
jgi:hypothetical protein